MRTSCAACRIRLAPGTFASFGRSRAMICCAVAFLSFSGFREMNIRAVIGAAREAQSVRHAGSALTISIMRSRILSSAWNEVS